MRTPFRIAATLLGSVILYLVGLNFLPHQESGLLQRANAVLQLLLFIISIYVVKREPSRKNKFVFVNFMVFFSTSIWLLAYDFVGPFLLSNVPFSRFIYYQYVHAAYIFLFSIAIVYLVIDLLFHNFAVFQKYLSTMAIVLFFHVWYFFPFYTNPMAAYSTEDINQWKALDTYVRQTQVIPSTEELAKNVKLQSWKDGRPIGDLFPEENTRRIEQLFPYLYESNYLILLIKPLYLSVIYMYVMMIGFIMLFFGYQYKKDPPQGAYIDKIMFTFLIFISTEIVHYWGYIKSIEWGSFVALFEVGQYVTALMLVLLVLFFGLRLRFISSVSGEFYEKELEANPHHVTRWRDWLDTLILHKFFSPKPYRGRLFQDVTK